MSEANFSGLLDYTRSSYWGGSSYPYWLLMVVTILFGFFGFDHLMLKSPLTAILKLIVNIVGLGFWYVYDMLQILGNKDLVMKHGLTAPFLGPLGIGAGTFTDSNPSKAPKSSLRTILFLILTILPIPVFGADLLVAGDMNGAIAKFFTMILPFLWPIAILWFFTILGYTTLSPKTLFEQGIPRVFPMNWFMDPLGPSKIGPKEVEGTNSPVGPGLFGSLIQYLVLFVPGVGPAVQGVAAATQATAAAVTAGAKVVETGAGAASEIIEAAKGPAVATVGIASGLAQQIPAAVGTATSAASSVGPMLSTYTNPTTLLALSKASQASQASQAYQPDKQVGGALTNQDSGLTDTALFIGLIGLLIGGIGMSIKTLSADAMRQTAISFNIPFGKKDGQSRDDTPPQPRKF